MNERVDHTNYEAWLLDRLEGNLSPDQEAALDAFLAQNPELAPIDNDLPSITAEPIGISFNKDLLKRSIPPQDNVTDASIEDHLIAKLEGDLSPEQLLALEKFLYEHPEHANADRLYALTKLVPQAMAYAAKHELERQFPPIGKVDKYTVDDHLVAQLEGDLSAEQELALEAYLKQHPEAAKAKQIMARTKIAADRVTYPQKESLKKGGKVIAISFQRTAIRYAAAASVAILFGVAIWSVVDRPDTNAGTEIVQNVDRTDGAKTPLIENQDERSAQAAAGTEVEKPIDKKVPVIGSDPIGIEEHLADVSPKAVTGPEKGPIGTQANASESTIVPDRNNEHIQLAEQRRIIPQPVEFDRTPIEAEVADVPVVFEPVEEEPAKATSERSITLGELLAGVVRERVRDEPETAEGPLNTGDAIAAVDKGLKAVAGDGSGITVERTGKKIDRFGLRLGNGFAITASTGR